MKLHHLILLTIPLLLNCPKKYAPGVKKIEAIYISSLYEDIYREEPIITGIEDQPGLKIGHLITDPPFMANILARIGFYDLLNKYPIDFIITDLDIHGENYFSIPATMGYAIKNYEGIRFAVVYKNKDSLAIDDQIKLSIIKQRSDVLWIIDRALIESQPMKIDFFIKDRGLADTTISPIEVRPDTSLLENLRDFKTRLEEVLNSKIYLKGKRLNDYIFSTIAINKDVNVILYPDDMVLNVVKKDSLTIREVIDNVSCELKFKMSLDMTKNELIEISDEKKCRIWGEPIEKNRVLLPGDDGEYLFDSFIPMDFPGNK